MGGLWLWPKSRSVSAAHATHERRPLGSVSLLENEDVLDRMAERLKARPEILNRRREVVEHPFASIKRWINQGAFLMWRPRQRAR